MGPFTPPNCSTIFIPTNQGASNLPFRYYTVHNIHPALTAKSLDTSCITSKKLTVFGHGFMTRAEYDASFAATDILDGYQETTLLLGKANTLANQARFFKDKYRNVTCNVSSRSEVVCPNLPGYQGPDSDEEDTVVLNPGLSLNGGQSWMTLCGAMDGLLPTSLKYYSPTQADQPLAA